MISGIAHIALRSKDVEASVDFYKRVGLAEVHRLYRESGALWLVYMRITDDQFLEIFPSGEGDVPPREQTGVNHISLAIEDIDAYTAGLEKAGVALTQKPGNGADGNRGAWITDPDGNRIELMQMRPNCIQFQAVKRWHEATGAKSA